MCQRDPELIHDRPDHFELFGRLSKRHDLLSASLICFFGPVVPEDRHLGGRNHLFGRGVDRLRTPLDGVGPSAIKFQLAVSHRPSLSVSSTS